MMTKNELLHMLENGADPNVIAKEFADKLNEAIAEKTATTNKRNEAAAVVKFFTTYYPALFEGLTVEILLQALDAFANEVKTVNIPKNSNKNNIKTTTTNAFEELANSFEDLVKAFGK